MGLLTKRDDDYGLSNLENYFSIPIEETKTNIYENIKNKVYKLDIDNEEKANIINKINYFNQSNIKNTNLEKEIDSIIDKYNL